MRLVVYAALVLALTLCFVSRRAARHLSPPLAAATLCGLAVLAAAAWVWNLALLAGTLIGRLRYVADYGHWSGKALAAHDPVPVITAALAGVLIVAAAAGLVWCCQRVGRELWRIWSVARTCRVATDDGVLIVADSAPHALAVPGLRGRVVITTAMIQALSVQERRVLLAHERTHLRCQHALFRLGVRLAAAMLPVLKPVVHDCDYQLERWADETAARTVRDRGLAAQALGRAALARHRATPSDVHSMALGFSDHGVVGRVQALLAEPIRNDLRSLTVPLIVLATTAMLTFKASRDLEALFELAMRFWAS